VKKRGRLFIGLRTGKVVIYGGESLSFYQFINQKFQCQVCGSEQMREELVNEVFLIDGKIILVENIPAKVCAHCGEATFSRETTEKIRRMVHGEAQPVKSIQVDVFAFA
jgi:YgiT-type zinc finger domain-containing protein